MVRWVVRTWCVVTGQQLAGSSQLRLCEALQCCHAAQSPAGTQAAWPAAPLSKTVLCEVSDPVQRRHICVQTLIAAFSSAGMTEASPTCTMGGLQVCLLPHLSCHANQHTSVPEAPAFEVMILSC